MWIGRTFELVQMDTDSIYMALSEDCIDDVVREKMKAE